MSLLHLLCVSLLLMGLSPSSRAEDAPKRITLHGLIAERRTDTKSVASWNAPSDPYYVLEISPTNSVSLRPSPQVSSADLRRWLSRPVTLTGYYTEGQRPETPLPDIVEQVPIEPKLAIAADGGIVSAGWQVLKRGSGLVVLAIAPQSLSMPGAVLDYEWAHASNRLAVLTIDGQRLGRLLVIDAERQQTVMEITLPSTYRPSCFAWLTDDSGFLLAMAATKPEQQAFEENFYRYRFDTRRFDPVYQQIERQFVDIFSIETDNGSDYWAVGSVGEGHPDVAIYRNDATVLMTDVFPWSITPLRWKNHRLTVLSEAYLQWGLTGTARAAHPNFDARLYPERGWGNLAAYRIDPTSKRADAYEMTAAALETETNASYDRRYRSVWSGDNNAPDLVIKPETGAKQEKQR